MNYESKIRHLVHYEDPDEYDVIYGLFHLFIKTKIVDNPESFTEDQELMWQLDDYTTRCRI